MFRDNATREQIPSLIPAARQGQTVSTQYLRAIWKRNSGSFFQIDSFDPSSKQTPESHLPSAFYIVFTPDGLGPGSRPGPDGSRVAV